MLPFVSEATGLFMFAVLYGLDWYASGPATTTIIARAYGSERVGTIFGTVFVFHQLGGASAAISGGWARVHFGDYQYAFLIGGCLGLLAACLALTIDRRNVEKQELRVAAELVGT
jgi:predicted MFS family arabinose efflux permease